MWIIVQHPWKTLTQRSVGKWCTPVVNSMAHKWPFWVNYRPNKRRCKRSVSCLFYWKTL